MRRHLNHTISHVIFVYLPSVHDTIIHYTDICTCSTSGCMIALRRNKIDTAMHKSLVNHKKKMRHCCDLILIHTMNLI